MERQRITGVSMPMQWVIMVVLALGAAMCMEVVGTLYRAFTSDSAYLVPKTLHTFWEVGFLVSLGLLVRRSGIPGGNFIGLVFGGMILSAIVWAVLPDSVNILEANYYGVESRQSWGTHPGGSIGESEVYDYPLEAGGLYSSDDQSIREELAYAERADVAYVGLRPFLTWQRGLAEGFYPDNRSVPQYPGSLSLLNRVVLYVTVGPVVLVEALITGLLVHFPLLVLAQVVFFLVKRQHYWLYGAVESAG